ncbi:class I SAM-dependent methyltransferase [Marixanthomonas spongiae]|uniref:SAM-dependent methyltransferase n=1 Tax=Marixanthomonas spongiae TaxID=2174845 RepID=A0A2U0HYM7_9FLAO|nr:class I SAM-dependent methyltransferase [Marixanthomonas spongiae]PVW13954.1 SAM-dependent methyltransferase [Marixanthomonas spongiae]
MQKETDTWYTAWFDTPYYHILYKDRDYEEAGLFMKELTSYLNLSTGAEILDLACGKGRHSKHLSNMGYRVTGVDLSETSIAYAKQFEHEHLHFEVHDMCLPYPKKFDAVFNLFTSFGYFEKENDNLQTIKAIKEELKPNGYGVIDFLNMDYIAKNLVPSEVKTVDGIDFYMKRYFENGYLFKDIRFTHENKRHFYTERVKALTLEDFKAYFQEAGVTLVNRFGDYHLNAFDKENSERLILIFN